MSQLDLPPLNWLRAFEASCRHLSFTGAAHELGMTQSAVSQQIKNLEGFLGKPMFYRRTRVLEITEAGRSYLPVVQDAFLGLSAGTRNLRGPGTEEVLQIQSNMSFAIFWLSPRLPRLFARHPWLRVLISTALWDPEKTAAASEVEIRYCIGQPDGHAKHLYRDVFYPVCAHDYEVSADTLFDSHFFDCNGLTANWENWCANAGLKLPQNKPITYATTLAVSIHAAETGAGVALGHDLLVRDLIKEGRLKRPFEGAAVMEESYYLLWSGDKLSRAQTAFLDWIEEEIEIERAGPEGPAGAGGLPTPGKILDQLNSG